MSTPTILFFAGSARKDSMNKKLAVTAAEMAKAHGVNTKFIDLADYPMPLYDGDLEAAEGMPAKAKELYDLMVQADGFVLAAPEYNSSITPLLKNTLDWVSRDGGKLAAYQGKVAGLLAASPGGLGGLRGLVHVRAILGNIGVHVVPAQAAVNGAHEAFNADGTLKNDNHRKMVDGVLAQVAKLATGLKA